MATSSIVSFQTQVVSDGMYELLGMAVFGLKETKLIIDRKNLLVFLIKGHRHLSEMVKGDKKGVISFEIVVKSIREKGLLV